ncbi:MAG TPA: acyl-CoA desaturase [Sphingobacterium sp.]|jgi:linoleoyl-CoA desaturase|nr:acyl-CoA desaturase [Sphingobacterium sp.]
MKSTIKFNNVNTLFSKSLKTRINNYFNTSGKPRTGDWRIFLKAVILLSSLTCLYTLLVFVQPYWVVSILLCMVLGVNFAAIGFNIMHDAGHNSFSHNTRVNTFLSYTLNLVGGNIYFWKLKHNIAHHTYTNIDGEDHDIEIKFMRIHHDQKLRKHHKYQRFYFIFLYGVSYLAWIFFQDYEKYFRQKLGRNSDRFAFPLREKFIFWISKAVHLGIFVVVPIILVGWLPTLIGLMIAGMVCGICLATVFQLAHVVSETEFKTIEAAKVEEEWMIHQLQTTANFATKNKVLTWLLGGLNFQVEHHLFPRISHVHYPAINKIVQQTCRDFQIKYLEFRSFRQAFKSHVLVLKYMSN